MSLPCIYLCVCVQNPKSDGIRVPIPEKSPEWNRVMKKLYKALPGARLTRLERVQNRRTWRRFYEQVASRHDAEDGGHIDFTRSGSDIRELWHYSGATDEICRSGIG